MGNLRCHYSVSLRLFKRTLLQEVDLLLCEIAPLAAGKILLGESGEIHAVEFHHMVAECLEDTAYHTVAARVNLYSGLLAVGRRYVAHSIGMDWSVVKLYAIGNVLHVVLRDWFVGPYLINLLLHIFRVSELRREVTVVGEQKHTGCVAVEAAYRIDALCACSLHEVHHSGASIGVVTCSYAIFWLVEQHIALALKCNHFVVVFHNVVACYLSSKLGHRISIHLDHSLLNQFISLTARAYSGVCHELVQADWFIRVNLRQNVLNALWARSEAHLRTWTLLLAVVAALLLAVVIVAIASTLLAVVAVASLLAVTVVESSLLAVVAVASLLAVVVVASQLAVVVIASLLAVVAVTTLLAVVAVASLLAVVIVATALLVRIVIAALLVIVAVIASLLAVVVTTLTVIAALAIVATLLAVAVTTLLAVVVISLIVVGSRRRVVTARRLCFGSSTVLTKTSHFVAAFIVVVHNVALAFTDSRSSCFFLYILVHNCN